MSSKRRKWLSPEKHAIRLKQWKTNERRDKAELAFWTERLAAKGIGQAAPCSMIQAPPVTTPLVESPTKRRLILRRTNEPLISHEGKALDLPW